MGSGDRGLLRDWDRDSIGVFDDVNAANIFSKEDTTFVSSAMRETSGLTMLRMLDTMLSRFIMRWVS